jgi:hypothetical protein
MSGINNKNGINYFDAVLVSVILFFGFLIYNNSVRNTVEINRIPVPASIAVSDNIAVFSPYLRIQVFQKIWILNKNNFNLLAFNSNPLSESRRAGIIACRCNILRQDYRKVPQFIFLCYQYPEDAGEPPSLC